MRKLLFFLILVIILVSLSWFRQARAQDVGTLTPADIARLKQQYEQTHQTAGPVSAQADVYTTPEIFAADSQPAPPDTVPAITTRTFFERDKALEPFEELRPFGVELFARRGEINPPEDIASSADYVLGPGDNVIVYLWGRVEREYNLTLDREGKVFIPKVGEIVGWGLTLDQFTARMKQRLSGAYSDFELTVSLGKIRSIRIYVTGEVRRPGAYTVSSLTSVLNALFTAGGPNERGSMRAVAVMRNGAPVATVDLYDLLLHGNNASDIRLQTGDAVFVPVVGARVAVRGEIKRSGLYELKGGEAMSQLFELAGRPTPEAYLDRVLLERITDRGEWEVRDLNLRCDSAGACDDIALTDGDRITVYSIFDLRTNMVAVCGHVKHPGYYERADSTRISDLIERGQLRPYDVHFERADLFRRYADRRIEVIPVDLARALAGDPANDILLADRDSLHIYSINDIQREQFVYVEGEVERPGQYPLYEGMTVDDLIFLAGSFRRGADRTLAELARLDSLGLSSVSAVSLIDPVAAATELQEDDHLFIRRIPDWENDRSVAISGEVRFPGVYWLTDHRETLYNMLTRAGGFMPNAFPRGLVFERRSISESLQRLNVPTLIEQTQPIILDSAGLPVKELVFSYRPETMSRVIIDVDRMLNTNGADGDIILEPGDRIHVPPTPSGISIMGAVGANGTLQFVDNRNVKDYIKRAGNFTRQADKDGTRLIRADGEVYSGGNVLGERVDLGDIIVVPSRISHDRDWLRTITTVVTATAGLVTSAYLVSRL